MNWSAAAAAIGTLVFAAAGLVAVSVIAATIAGHWRRIRVVMADSRRHVAEVRAAVDAPLRSTDDRWRRVHIAADQRPPLRLVDPEPRERPGRRIGR